MSEYKPFHIEDFRHLYPFKSNWFENNGIRQHYLDEGEGPPIVMVHGNPSWSFLFRALVPAFRHDHRVIVPDHIGCGLSDKPDAKRYSYTLEQRIRDLEALIAHLGVTQPITLVLHDWGGAIGMGFANRHALQVKRLVLMNTGAFPLPDEMEFPWPLWIFRNSKLGEWLNRGLNAFAEIAARTCTRTPLSEELRRAFTGPYDSWANRVATTHFVQDIPLRPGDPSWGTIKQIESGLAQFRKTPTLICWGQRDFIFRRAFFNTWRKHLPQAETHSFPEAGHYLLEDVGEKVIGLMRDFFTRHPV
ncbi:MAG TPA: alpha/beta fold hydrolase [Candidatus Ozemobacteraceae bacterium]|nr:alpha/beta fold hydrolase [Candidatus Ozemobacteraceae bacterium]HQG29336.1 alpha/beta fold hydrolase [Candidatus Ozemobacteraceae bacterium]